MGLTIAAVRTGFDPVGKLPEGAFHRTLEDQLICPKCDASYNLIVEFDQSVGRHFAEESRRLIMLLKKAVFQGHSDGHRVVHFETSGVVVRSFGVEVEKKRIVKGSDLLQ
jgi:hypothetical protein